jgi:hypothetical protein
MLGTRLDQAKSALTASIDALPKDSLAGLRQYAGGCGDGGSLLVAPAIGNRNDLRGAVAGLVAGGGTPTPDALRSAAADFPSDVTERVIVLVSDGESTCGDPCPVAQELNSTGVSFKAYTVGFQASGQAEDELACIARATGGEYFAATDTSGLQEALNAAFSGVPGLGGMCVGQGAGGWSFSAKVSSTDGIIIEGASLGSRWLAQGMSVPYLVITADWGLDWISFARQAELTPKDGEYHGLLTSRLIRFDCRWTGEDSIGVDATYSINGLPPGVDMWVNQSYRFDHPKVGDQCEPTGMLACARFWPTVTWGVDQSPTLPRPFLRTVEVVQRLAFRPDAGARSRGDIFRDRARGGGYATRSAVETLGSGGSMKYEDRVPAIVGGRRIQDETWDSWHQTNRDKTSAPGIRPPRPGCAECVHMHWAWGGAVKNQFPYFTDGNPQILEGSQQTAHIAVVKDSPLLEEIDPWRGGYQWLIDERGKDRELRESHPVVFWEMSSPGTGVAREKRVIAGRLFPLADAAWPQLPHTLHGGNGSMFFAPPGVE